MDTTAISRRVHETGETIQISVMTMAGKVLVLEVQTTDTIGNVKTEIHRELGVPPSRQRLIFDGKVLGDDGRTLADCGVGMESAVLHLAIRRGVPGSMEIFVRVPSGRTLSFMVEGSDTVSSVKEKVRDREGVPLLRQRVMYDGKQLQDGSTLAEYNVTMESTLYIVARLGVPHNHADFAVGPPAQETILQISVMAMAGKVLALDVRSIDTIGNVKTKIHLKLGVPPSRQRLVFDGKVLGDDGRTLADCGVGEESAFLHLAIRRWGPGSMEIFVRVPSGRTHSFIVEGLDTVWSVMHKVRDTEGVPLVRQRIIYHGRRLEEGRTLAEYKLMESTLHVVLRLGGPHNCADCAVFAPAGR